MPRKTHLAKPHLIKNKKTHKRYLVYNKKRYPIQSTASDKYLIKNFFDIIKQLIAVKKRRGRSSNKKSTYQHHQPLMSTGSNNDLQKIQSYEVSNKLQELKKKESQKQIKANEDKNKPKVLLLDSSDAFAKAKPENLGESKEIEHSPDIRNKSQKIADKIKRAEADYLEIGQKIKLSEKTQKELDIEINKLISQRDNVKEELEKLSVDYSTLKEKYHTILEEKEDLTTQITNIQHRIKELEDKGKEKEKEIELLANNLENLNKELDNKENELKSAKNILHEINIDLTVKEVRLNNANEEISKLKVEKDDLKKNIMEADEDLLVLKEKLRKTITTASTLSLDSLRPKFTADMLKTLLKKFNISIKEHYTNKLDKNGNFNNISKLSGGPANYIDEIIQDEAVSKMSAFLFQKKFEKDMETPEIYLEKKQVVETPIPSEKRKAKLKAKQGYLKQTASSSKRNETTSTNRNITPIQLKHLSNSPPNTTSVTNLEDENLDNLSPINTNTPPPFLKLDKDGNIILLDNDDEFGNGLSDNQKGLWDYEIKTLMKNYAKYGFVGVYSIDNLNKVHVNPNKESMSFIMNIMPSSVKLGHWVSIYLTKHNLEYYDPLAQSPSELFMKNIKPILNKWTSNPLQFKINRIKTQSVKTDTCGWHSINFLIKRYKGESFKDITGYNRMIGVIKSEKAINKFKKKFNLPDFELI
jgi:predicted  nucleic acid-binding Zn-ribbon protein